MVLRGLAVAYEDIATLHAILTSYGASVSSHSEGVDFEDIEKMYTLLDTIVNDHPSVKSENVVIDMTGGQKSVSVAATLATLG